MKNILILIIIGSVFSCNIYASGNDHFIRENDFSPEGGIEKSWDPDDSNFEGSITCSYSKCVSLEEAARTAVDNGYPKRVNLELVFQARQRILSSIGHLVPRLEFTVGRGDIPSSALNTVSSMLGFLMPSNWFDWKESKLIYEAQKSSFTGILRNVITDTETLYYNIHRVSMDLKIYEYYANHLTQFIEEIRSSGKASEDDILMLTNLRDEIVANAAYLNGVISSWYTYDIAVAMAYPNQGELGINPIQLPDLRNVPTYPVTESDLERVKNNSTDLQTLHHLIKAAHYSRLSRIFSFLSPSGSNENPGVGISFGIDNIADIRIASSEKHLLEIQMEETAARLESTFRKLVDTYNASVDLYKQYQNAKGPNRALFKSVLERYNNEGNLSAEKLIRAIDWALKFELNRNFVQHLNLITKTQMDNLLVNGERYSRIPTLVPERKPLIRRKDRLKIREDREIEKDLQNGILVIE
jgi:hypothetical protein